MRFKLENIKLVFEFGLIIKTPIRKWSNTPLHSIFERRLQGIPTSPLSWHLQKYFKKIFELLSLETSLEQCCRPISSGMDIPAYQKALFVSASHRWRLEMGSWILANWIILLLINCLQNVMTIHILIISGTDLYVNLHMAFYSVHIYMQESQRPGTRMLGCPTQLNGKHSLNVCGPCPFPFCFLTLNHPLS